MEGTVRWTSIYQTIASVMEPMETPIKVVSIISVNISGFWVFGSIIHYS